MKTASEMPATSVLIKVAAANAAIARDQMTFAIQKANVLMIVPVASVVSLPTCRSIAAVAKGLLIIAPLQESASMTASAVNADRHPTKGTIAVVAKD